MLFFLYAVAASVEIEFSAKVGALPLDPGGVSPPSFALRGGSVLHSARISGRQRRAGVILGDQENGVWGLRPQRVQRRALAFL